ncbi:MAG: gliding motility-associated C-terminal domain-containing protein [Taibaiella sp.]|jgi:gliding motility-associated-like protein
MSEKMTITKGADCYYWLLAHRWNGPAYRAFKINATGIQPAVSSNGTWQGSLSGGQLKISFNGTRIANSTEYGVEIGAFDNATGIVSNTGTLDSLPGNGHFGASFSPDDQKLYIGSSTDISQYDLSLYPNFTAVATSKTTLSLAPSFHAFGQFRNGPDGKIYVGFFGNYPYLAVVNIPNNSGTTCNFNLMGLLQPASALGPPGFSLGLGNDIVVSPTAEPDTVINSVTDTLLCFSDSYQAAASGVSDNYLWDDGNTNASRILTQDGSYWVYGYQNCGMVVIDSFKVKFMELNVNIGPDTAICPGDSLLLDAGNPGANYYWQDNTNAATMKVKGSGIYSVTVTKEECVASDSIAIATINPGVDIPEEDTTICAGQDFILHATSEEVSHYTWSDASIQANITVNRAGTYIVVATNVCGIFSDSVIINTKDCQCLAFVPNVFSPNDDGKNDRFKVQLGCNTTSFKLAIYNRYGQRIFQANDQSASWDGFYNGKYADAGTYFYYLEYKNGFGATMEKKGDLTVLR